MSFTSFQHPDDFKRLRDVFEAARYNDAAIIEVLGVKDIPSLRGEDVPLLLRRTNQGTPLDTLIRLFLIEVPCDRKEAQRAFQPMTLEKLADAGLIHADDTRVKAVVKLLPFHGLLIAFDSTRMLQTEFKKDYVMGIGRSTLTLANLTVRRQAGMALDLGTGCGIQAFLAARHSSRVLAVDKNPRAVHMASFNARLNGLSHVACLEGDLFGPVQGRMFDLIVTNPPFVISPEMKYIYRDSGMEADQVCQKIISQVPRFLNDGGYCHILCNWTEHAGQDWRERLRGWFQGTGCDVWVMRSETRDAATYAATWIRHTEKEAPEDFDRHFEKWMAYYDQQGITAMGAGLITMHRSAKGRYWYRADDAPEKMLGPCGDSMVRGFELQDFLETVQDDSLLLNTRFRVSPDVCLERLAKPSAAGWVDETIRLHISRGLAYSGNIDSYMANVIVKCDGQRQLKDLLAEIANAPGVDLEKIRPIFCQMIRGLVERGFLLPRDLHADFM